MDATLPRVAHEHHERILHQVDMLPELGEALLSGESADLKHRLSDASAFFSGTLLPHMEAAERALYPELERQLQNRHSMTPMRREHTEIRSLVVALGRTSEHVDESRFGIGARLAIRRIVFQLYALLKIHLAEEDAYRHLVEHGVSDEVAAVLATALDHPIASPEPVEPKP